MMSHSIKMLREPPLRNTKTPPTPQAEQKHKVKRGGQYEDRHHTVRREAASEGHPRVISAPKGTDDPSGENLALKVLSTAQV